MEGWVEMETETFGDDGVRAASEKVKRDYRSVFFNQ